MHKVAWYEDAVVESSFPTQKAEHVHLQIS